MVTSDTSAETSPTAAQAAIDRPCPLCGSSDSTVVAERLRVPVLLNRLAPSSEEAKRAKVGHLKVVCCRACGFTYNSRFEPGLVEYDEAYENDQSSSPRFAQHLERRMAAIASVARRTGSNALIEIGCGQGGFLERLIAQPGLEEASAVGYDSAWRRRPLPARVQIEPKLYDRVAASRESGQHGVCFARHVIEHVPDPVDFLANARLALKANGVALIETPAIEWILSHGQMQDFFYEHCNYFSQATLGEALSRAGFRVRGIELVFGGQYLWAEAVRDTSPPVLLPPAATGTRPDVGVSQGFFARWRERLIHEGRDRGTVAVWGAGAKGITFVTEADPNADLVDFVVDLNPKKQGRFTPVTAHPVVSPDEAAERRPSTIVLMNPNYRGEVEEALRSRQIDAQLLEA